MEQVIEKRWARDNQTRYGLSHDNYLQRVRITYFNEKPYVNFDIYRNGININNGQFPLNEDNRKAIEWLGVPKLLES